jgi:hypothetical protein
MKIGMIGKHVFPVDHEIQDRHIVTVIQKARRQYGPYIAGTSGDKEFFHFYI